MGGRVPGGGTEKEREGGGAQECWLAGGAAANRDLATVFKGLPGKRFGCCWNTEV